MLARLMPAGLYFCEGRHHTRMIGRQNLSDPHAKLAVGLPESACSHSLCPPHTSAPYAVCSISCGGRTRMAGWWKLSVPPAAQEITLPKSACSHSLCPPHTSAPYAVRSTSCGGRTRMEGMWNLSVLHAKLELGLLESKCSPILCGGRYPNDGMVESVIPAHAAGNQLVRQCMLAQSVPPRTNFFPAQTCYHQSVGYGGLPPCSPSALDLPRPNAGGA